jgi:predicted FMN-binding regulatory protein PaiB
LSTDRYAPRSDEDIHRLIAENPFAWVVSGFGAEVRATPLPIRPSFDKDGELRELLGHFARSNPQLTGLRADPRAMILFLGPHGYVSPSWMADRSQAPTWNYASAQVLVEIELVEDAAGVEFLLRDLVGAMEAGRPRAWSVEDMGARYASLSRGVVGFRARILEVRARFKLGQDERDDVFADIMAGLEASGALDLRDWMAAFDSRD